MVEDFVPGIDIALRHFIWPTIVIGVGLLMILRSRKRRSDHWNSWSDNITSSFSDASGEVVDIVFIFGGTKETSSAKTLKVVKRLRC